MNLLEVGNLGSFIVAMYVVFHLPAIIMLIIGLAIRKRNAKAAKVLFTLTGIYFLVGAGICGGMLGGI